MSKQNNKNFYDWRFFPLATGVNHTGGATCCKYLREFSKKFAIAPMVFSGAGEKLIHEKNQKSKISWHCPCKGPKHIEEIVRGLLWRKDSDTGFSCRCIIIYFPMKTRFITFNVRMQELIYSLEQDYLKLNWGWNPRQRLLFTKIFGSTLNY